MAEGVPQVPAEAVSLSHFTCSLISVSVPGAPQISNQTLPLSPRSAWLLALTKLSLSKLGLFIFFLDLFFFFP